MVQRVAENGRQRKFQSVNVVRNKSEFIFVATTEARGRAVDNKIFLKHDVVCKTVLGSDYFSPGLRAARYSAELVQMF